MKTISRELIAHDLDEMLPQLKELFEDLVLFRPSVRVSVPEASPGAIDVLLAGWDGTSWVTKTLATLEPGESFAGIKLDVVPETSGMKKGDFLLFRTAHGSDVAIYDVSNHETYMAFLRTVTPAVFPYWQGTTLVRQGVINPNQTTYSYLLKDWQDVLYYWLIE